MLRALPAEHAGHQPQAKAVERKEGDDRTKDQKGDNAYNGQEGAQEGSSSFTRAFATASISARFTPTATAPNSLLNIAADI